MTDPYATLRSIDDVIAAAIEWRHADENDDDHEADRLIDAVDRYEAAVLETGVRG